MAKKAGASDRGGGPGTQTMGGVKTTQQNPLGKRVAGKRSGGGRGGRTR